MKTMGGLLAILTCVASLAVPFALATSIAAASESGLGGSQTAACFRAATGHAKLTKADLAACTAETFTLTKPCPSGPGLEVVSLNGKNVVLRETQRPVKLPKNYTFNQLNAVCHGSATKNSAANPHPKSGASSSSTSTTLPESTDLLAVWCGLTLGESKASVLQAMGTPHGTSGTSWMASHGISGDTAEWDNVSGDILLVTFENGVANKLQAYAGTIGPGGATNLSCPAFRY